MIPNENVIVDVTDLDIRPMVHGTPVSVPPRETVLKRFRVAAGSARTIHDYLRPPRLPSLPRFLNPSLRRYVVQISFNRRLSLIMLLPLNINLSS